MCIEEFQGEGLFMFARKDGQPQALHVPGVSFIFNYKARIDSGNEPAWDKDFHTLQISPPILYK